MGPYIVYYIVASIIAIPFLAYHHLRTRRDLSELREELRARGLIASRTAPHQVDGSMPEGLGALPTDVNALAIEVERLAERQRLLATAIAEHAGGRNAPRDSVRERLGGGQ